MKNRQRRFPRTPIDEFAQLERTLGRKLQPWQRDLWQLVIDANPEVFQRKGK